MSKLRTSPHPATWPALLTLRRRLGVADARPWNATHTEASLRVRRGGTSFIRDCASELQRLGAPATYSPPLPHDQLARWKRAGFEETLELALLRLDLPATIAAPTVAMAETADIDAVVDVDRAAFGEFWALDRNGIAEARRATRHGAVLVAGEPAVGYAVAGYGATAAYLQRVAVHPDHQGRGIGTALIATVAKEASRRGARSLFLNTQTDNSASLRLYEAIGFSRIPEGLHLMKR